MLLSLYVCCCHYVAVVAVAVVFSVVCVPFGVVLFVVVLSCYCHCNFWICVVVVFVCCLCFDRVSWFFAGWHVVVAFLFVGCMCCFLLVAFSGVVLLSCLFAAVCF